MENRHSAGIDPLFIVAPIGFGGSVLGLCFDMQYFVSSSFAIILLGKSVECFTLSS